MNSSDLLKDYYEHSNMPFGFLDKDGKLIWANKRSIELYPSLAFPDGIKLYLSAEAIDDLRNSFHDQDIKAVVATFMLTSEEVNFTKTPDGWAVNFPIIKKEHIDISYGSKNLRANMSISNHLRSPINNILSSLFSLYYNPQVLEIPGVSGNLLNINKGAYSLLRTTQLITNYLSLATGNSGENKEVIELCSFIYQLVQSVNILLRSSKMQINQNICVEPIYICADQRQIEMLVLELLSNALKASDENGYIAITLKEKNKKAILSVTDTGWGMSSEVLDKLFTPYYSFSHTGEPYSGLGLGLTNCRFIAAYNGATMAITSQDEKGTTVAVNFELYDEPIDSVELNSANNESVKNRFSPLYIVMSEICGAPNP